MKCRQCGNEIPENAIAECGSCAGHAVDRSRGLQELSRKLQADNERLRIELKAWGEAGRDLMEAIKPGSSKEKQIVVVKEISRLLGP